jgi:protein ImuA
MSRDDLVSHAQVWRGLDSHAPVTVSSGFEPIDRYLPGRGWPRTAITEIFIDRYGIGELSLLMPALALLSRATDPIERWIVWIAPPFVPYAPALLRYGIDLDHVLLVHPQSAKSALWALEQVLRSNSSIAVLAWLKNVPSAALRRIQLAAEKFGCWAVLFRPVTALHQSSPAALRIRLTPSLKKTRVEFLKCRGRRPGSVDIEMPGPGSTR